MTRAFLKISISLLFGWILVSPANGLAQRYLPISVQQAPEGAPVKLGIPFKQGALASPDHVRLLDLHGDEIPCQTTMVTTWEPVDYSVKWLWVFFFSTGEEEYKLEYGPDVIKAPIQGTTIKIKNAQRLGQATTVTTGPLKFSISKRAGGFIDDVVYDVGGDGLDNQDTIATAFEKRGSFLDLLDELGVDSSRAIIHRTIRERGSGPLHAIIRLEGEYTYSRKDNRPSPFIIRIHLYAGKSYMRIFHTLTYTGIPDQHTPEPGEHANIALAANVKIKNDQYTQDSGWIKPKDQIHSTGLSLQLNIKKDRDFSCGYSDAKWYDEGKSQLYTSKLSDIAEASIFQTGPKPDRIPPVPNATMDERIDGFKAQISEDNQVKKEIERASGWADLSDDRWGVSIGIRNFLEEYPKEIQFDIEKGSGTAFLWSPKAGPMSFARATMKREQGMIDNFAEGVTKTSELIINFHPASSGPAELAKTMNYVLDPPVANTSPEVYAQSGVYGQFSPRSEKNEALERSLDYKFSWEIFNQHWEPWYGMFDYGDQKNYFLHDDWFRWQNNEPAIDFMYWLQFMRTGDARYYRAAEAMSRHTMDVDNIHWPTDPPYYGDTNDALDYWQLAAQPSKASPFLGIGRRHATQHWVANLSAHVWLQGWLASYYMTGYHRGLDIARLTADSYLRRNWGEHGLTGRRLYLSIWNLVEAWDATKDHCYLEELADRVDRLLQLQNGPDQYDNLAIDRYGYSQIYVSHGLYKYYQLTGEERIKQALIRHARAVRDNPPYNHEYESYLATIHSLVVGYEFTKEASFLNEAKFRAHQLKTNKLEKPFSNYKTQKELYTALEEASNLPTKGPFQTRERWVSNWAPTSGLRVFGWTHIYNLPWLVNWMEEDQQLENITDKEAKKGHD